MDKRVILMGVLCTGMAVAPVHAILTPKKIIQNIEDGISDAVYRGAVEGMVNRLHDFIQDSSNQDKGAVVLAAAELLGLNFEDLKAAQDKGYDIIAMHIAGMLKDAGYGEDTVITKFMKTCTAMYLSSDQYDRVEKALELKRELQEQRAKLQQAESDLDDMWTVSKKVLKIKKRKKLTAKIEELKKSIKDVEKEIKTQDSPAKRVLMQIITQL